MAQVNLKSNEDEIVIRNIVTEDLDELAALSMKCFGPDMSLNQKHFVSQLALFPEGQICLEYNGQIVGMALSLIVNFEEYGDNHNYDEISDLGFIRNHNPKGRNLYGIEVGVNQDFRGLQLGRQLYDGRKRICKEFNLDSIVIGGRMPNYYKHAERLSANDYAEEVVQGKIYDPVLTFQMKNGFELINVIANYLEGDTESLEYGALMEWRNIDYAPKSV